MPIKDKSLYPADWAEISRRTRDLAGGHCEECGIKNHLRGYRTSDGGFMSVPDNMSGYVGDSKIIRIVLTVAHLDHNPANCAQQNLRALCQRCHLRYDRFEHGRNAAETRRRKAVRA